MKDLGLIPTDFPNSRLSVNAATKPPSVHADPNNAPCGCPLCKDRPSHPDNIPFEPTPENRKKLELWILQRYASSAINVSPQQPLQTMTGQTLHINFKPDAIPFAVHCPIPVPHHWKTAVKADLDHDVALSIIEPVPQGTPTIWCSRMVVAPKKDGSPRRTVDLQKLNKATLRETHHTPSSFKQVSTVPPHTTKTVLDAWNGYHSILLYPETRDATTFIVK